MSDLGPSQDERPPLTQPVSVVTDPDPQQEISISPSG
jgi:hypothetical protein